MTYRALYQHGLQRLEQAGIAEAALDARLLLEYLCHTDRNTLLVHGEEERSELEAQCYDLMLEKRASRQPLQYILGCQEFMGLTFLVNEHTLIPRQDTELLVEEAMRHLWDGMRILDMCTGSGCILLSLLHYSNECAGVGVDISAKALEVAKRNATALGLGNASFLESDVFSMVSGTFDMIVSNPPYIASAELSTLQPEVRDFEPVTALDGREDGLFFYKKIIPGAFLHLAEGGWLLLEIGCTQAGEVERLLSEAGFCEISLLQDYAGLDRVLKGKRPGPG